VFLRRFFEPGLAQTSYLIGCASAGEAIVIDPNRDVEQYITAARAEGAAIRYVTETHIHADFVSGSRELAARTDADVILSDEGGEAWRYGFAGDPRVRRVKHGARVDVGNVRIEAVHTPGHTPEHLSFLITDRATAEEPMGAATGDFIFVGDVGRPDLLERAAHVAGTMDSSARALYRSLRHFADRPDWLQIWPGHGAGSACGKGISAIPQSTLGYERRFNWAFREATEDAFVHDVLAGQPEPPTYFAMMKRINKEGPRVMGVFPHPARLEPTALSSAMSRGAVVDVRKAAAFAVGHVPGTLNIPLNKSFSTWSGWLLPYDADLFLIVDGDGAIAERAASDAARALALIGIDRVAGYFDAPAIDAWAAASDRPLGTIPQLDPADLAESIRHGGVTVIDVRGIHEWEGGHIAGAKHITLGYLPDEIADIPRGKPIVLHCEAGGRSSIAASVLKAHGIDRVINLAGGLTAWGRAGLPIEHS
jgi:hydroxyacylglutathione hydrolase